MNIAQLLLPEFDREMAKTRKVLAHVPADKMDWQANENLRTVGWNANHLADIVAWTTDIIELSEFDMAPVKGPKPEVLSLSDPEEVLACFDKAVDEGRAALESTSDATFAEPWSLKMGGETLFTINKGDCVRTWVMNHSIHHRAILSIYLRMLGVDITPVYDE